MRRSRLPSPFPPFARRALAVACFCALLPTARAATYTVSSEAELQAAIAAINVTAGAHFIDLRTDIDLTASLPTLLNTVSIRGNGYTLNGQDQYQLFTLGDPTGAGPRILVQLSNLTLSGGLVQGEDGVSGGGGGLGAGGAILVNSRADVLLSNVTVTDSAVAGGSGSLGGGGDGGGYAGLPGGAGAVGSAGDGSYGAGGGGSQTADGGDGGYGAGGGAGATAGGSGGLGGGSGGLTGGGGGAGLGGAIFVAEGGSLSISGSGQIVNNEALAGGSAGDGQVGGSAGSGIFLAGSGNLLLRVAAGQQLSIADNISDSVGAGLAPAASYQQWNLLIAGGGSRPVDPDNPELGVEYGTVALSGTNRLGGNLFVEGADVLVASADALIGGGVVALNDGGLVLESGITLSQDIAIDNGGGRIGVTSGESTLVNDISGTGPVVKTGLGNLVLAGTSSHVGSWVVQSGGLVLDSDSRLGSASLHVGGGAIVFSSAFNNLRNVNVLSSGTIDNSGLDVTLNSISGWVATPDGNNSLTFRGSGTTTLAGTQNGFGDTNIEAGRVVGAIAHGNLTIDAPATYDLGGADRQVSALSGAGAVVLGGNRLTIAMGDEEPAPSAAFAGRITGSGGLTLMRSVLPPGFDPLTSLDKYGTQTLAAGNTYSGGTTVRTGMILAIADDSSVGTGPVTLAGGALASTQASSSLGIVLAGGGGLIGDLQMNGVISGAGTLYKLGAGTLTLNNANTYVGDTLVGGEGSYLALAHPDGLGFGNLQLTQGGGLKVLTDTTSLRPIQILDGVGVIDVGTHDVQSTGGIDGLAADSGLRKEGTGRLLLTGTLNMPGGVAIAAGTLQVGDGGTGGSLSGNVAIADGAHLVIDRADTMTFAGDISGSGDVLVNGVGTVILTPGTANTFLGGLTVLNGTVAAASEQALGFGDVTLDANGGLLLLGDIDRDVTIGAGGGRFAVDAGNSFSFDGDLAQQGLFSKTGAGTLLFTGVAGDGGDVQVAEGTLQIGSGMEGTLISDVGVLAGATLVFGRDDLTQYSHVIAGDGTVIKRGAGELVLTADQLFSGTFQVEAGNLRVGLGGTSGALNGDVDLAAGSKLIFDRSDASTFFGDTAGAGFVQKSGPGRLTVVGDLAHGGGTQVTSGELVIGNGGTVGSIAGNVGLTTGTRLVINRSDAVAIGANLSGAGTLVQRGSGTTILTGSNTQSGGVLIEGGRLGVDSDARLGFGELIMDGGQLRYEAAFGDLRDIRLRAGGGGLDTNGFNVGYDNEISGGGLFTKSGAGRLTVTTLLASDVNVVAGELRVGNGAERGVLTGAAHIASGATLSLSRSDVVNFTGALTGSGDLRQLGSGELRLPGNNAAFNGHTFIDNGNLRLDGVLGGDLTLAAGTWVQGNGLVQGDLAAGAGAIRPGNSFGTLGVGGNLLLGPASVLQIEVDASGAGDRVNVGGSATLDGTLHVLPQPGDYTRAGCCTYTVLSAAGGVSGRFDRVQNDLVFLATSVSYQPTQVDVSFTRNSVSFTTVSLSWNQQQVASAIDALEAADASDPRAALIAPLSAAQARDAFESLSGDSLLVAVNASAHSAARFSQVLSRRGSRLGLVSRGGASGWPLADLQALQQGRLPQAPLPPAAASLTPFNYDGPTSRIEGVWVEALALSTSENSDDTVGSAGGSLDGQLLALGVDGYWREELLLGFAAGTMDGDLAFDNRVGEGSASGQFAGLYGRWDSGAGLQYKGALSLAALDSEVTRQPTAGSTTARTQADFATSVITAGFEAGLPMHLGSLGLRPHALLDVQLLQRDAFTETGDAALALQADAVDAMLGEFGVGLELSRPWLTGGQRWAQLQGSLALLQPFGDTQREQTLRFSGTSNSFVVKATPDDSAALALSFGAEVYLSTQIALWGGYEGRMSGTSQAHNGVLSMQYRW
jgi:autotransporter-associated beta strand protein